MEGLHALNPVLIPGNLAPEKVFRMYVYPRLALKVDAHIEFPPDFLRLLRRIVRDNKTRGATVQKTLSMWDSVCRGEQRWINPFRDHADVIFNSSTEYELVVLKKHILPLLAAVSSDDPWYARVCEIVELLTPIETMDVEDEIPPTSLVREFIGGNTFYK